ncbi:hypothetical protein DL769_009733 [Monosporascus sp. CRB-8-3]|nr:hypothetical protein DL769_009733 [Monosporascus sp. CRB-8-3]
MPSKAPDAHELQNIPPAADEPDALVQQKWNDPPINRWRVLATFITFSLVGASDGVYGALVPSIREDFKLSNTVVSLIFMTPFFGYTIATIIISKMSMSVGQRGIAIIGALCHLIPFTVMAVHPPHFAAYLVFYIFVGLANGLLDAAWNAWIGDMVNANALMGLLHAFYGLGATISPTVATNIIGAGLGWWTFYWTLVGAAALELACAAFFWAEDAQQFRIKNPKTSSTGKSRTSEAIRNKVTWMIALFLFVYMGVEVSVGGWIVDFMMHERGGSQTSSGYVATGFWAGVTIGRLALGLVNEWLGERLAISFYLTISVGIQLIFWLVPSFVLSAVMVALLGFFTGPLFPGAIVVEAKLLPKHLHTPGIGFASAFAGGGGAILPFVAGAIAGPHGVNTLQPFVLALLIAITIFWMLLPRQKKATAGDA